MKIYKQDFASIYSETVGELPALISDTRTAPSILIKQVSCSGVNEVGIVEGSTPIVLSAFCCVSERVDFLICVLEVWTNEFLEKSDFKLNGSNTYKYAPAKIIIKNITPRATKNMFRNFFIIKVYHRFELLLR